MSWALMLLFVLAMPLSRPLSARDGGAARLSVVPASPYAPSGRPGYYALGIRTKRDSLIYVPKSYRPDVPAPLLVALHGAGGGARGAIRMFQSVSDSTGVVILAPSSLGRTWDLILSEFGEDVEHLDRALRETFGHYAIDPRRVAISGFSDGASYALSVGLANGDVFTHVLALSPGFVSASAPVGNPGVFVSHGASDSVLPVEHSSRRIVAALRSNGYAIRYEEFIGGHEVPATILQQAMRWLREPF